ESFLLEIDAESVDVANLLRGAPWVTRARVILIRATLGYFWTGGGDLRRIVQWWKDCQFGFIDVLDYLHGHVLNAPLGRVLVAFERSASAIGGVKDLSNEKESTPGPKEQVAHRIQR